MQTDLLQYYCLWEIPNDYIIPLRYFRNDFFALHSSYPIHHCFQGLFNQLSNPRSILVSVTAGTRFKAGV